jgi:hypothetical protein
MRGSIGETNCSLRQWFGFAALMWSCCAPRGENILCDNFVCGARERGERCHCSAAASRLLVQGGSMQVRQSRFRRNTCRVSAPNVSVETRANP